MTTELIHVLDEEERRWAQTLHIEEYQSHLACSVIQVQSRTISITFSLNETSVLSLMSFKISEGKGGFGQIYICEPVSRSKSGSLQSHWIG